MKNYVLSTEKDNLSSCRKYLLMMKMLIAFLLCSVFQIQASSLAQTVTIHKKDMTFVNILREIKKQTGYTIICSSDILHNVKASDVDLKNKPLEEALELILSPNNLGYYVEGKSIVVRQEKSNHSVQTMSLTKKPEQQTRTIRGRITDIGGEPLSGISVLVKGTTKGTSTDSNGEYAIDVSANDAVLIFSSIGFVAQEISTVGKTQISVVLQSESSDIDEVVVTALGIKREEKSLGYAVQKVSGEALQTVKGVDVVQSLTGKTAGLVIKNTTEFYGNSGIEMRGESPLLVINGVPYGNMSLKDIPADEIEEITMLKGATAAALYGSRGSAGAVMITTKGGVGKGLAIDFNSNTMFRAGWVAIPKAQTSYGHGLNGEIADDYVWGPKLDIGNTAMQWNPKTKQMEEMPLVSSGKDNFKNFLEPGMISNNNISITQTGENGFFRSSLSYVRDKGQYPNQKMNKINYSLNGELKLGDKFSIESQMGYLRSAAPQIWGGGYNAQGYIYQILMWSGPDYDLRDYKDYWVTPNEKQNWLYDAWYDNPYLIAYEKLLGLEENKLNASLTMNYSIQDNLKLVFRNGYDTYRDEDKARNPAGIYSDRGPSVSGNSFGWNGKGFYGVNQRWGNSINSDLMLMYNKSVGEFDLDVLGGGSLYYYQDKYQGAKTVNGLSVPGWYSLANAVPSDAPGINSIDHMAGTTKQQVNSVYGKLSIAWKDAVYLDVTGRNDWSSTQPENERSYFYPSVVGSVVLSEFMDTPTWLSMWKLRGSWTIAKSPLGVYDSNRPYSVSNAWGLVSSLYPENLIGNELLPSETRTWEVGTAGYFFNKRLYVDVAYFDKLYYHRQIEQDIAHSSGFKNTLINTKETYARRGLEITLSGTVLKKENIEWNSMFNYSYQHRYFVDIDPVHSKSDQWTKPGKRLDYYAETEKVLRDPEGNMIHRQDGNVWLDNYRRLYGYKDPNFSFGFTNNVKWKDWTFGVSIDGRIGGLMDNYVYGKMFDTGSAPETDTPERYDEVVNGKKYIGKGVKVVSGSVKYDTEGNILEDTRQYAPNDIPVSYQEYTRLLGNSWESRIHNQSFIKLRELSVSYNLPSKWINNSVIRNAAVSLTGQNLWLWTKDFKYSDPDVGDEDMNAPSQRMLGINLKIGF